MSHMRSRSTLLSHILGNNSDIVGYRELHQNYTGERSLLKMKFNLSSEFGDITEGKYLLDKVLHDHAISSELLERIDCTVIVLVRKPIESIASIIKNSMTASDKSFASQSAAVDYYCTRLESICSFMDTYKGKLVFLESDQILDTPDSLLSELTEWLSLSSPLKSEYEHFQNTGKGGHGDRGNIAKYNQIEKIPNATELDLPDSLYQRAKGAYESCLDRSKQGYFLDSGR